MTPWPQWEAFGRDDWMGTMCWCIRWRSFLREDTCTNSWLKSSFNSRIHSLPSATFLSAEMLLSTASQKDCSMILGSLKAGSPFCRGKLSKTSTSKTCKAILPLKEKPCDGYDRSCNTMDNWNPTEGIKTLVQHQTRTILKPLPLLGWKPGEQMSCCYQKTWRVIFDERRGGAKEECCE